MFPSHDPARIKEVAKITGRRVSSAPYSAAKIVADNLDNPSLAPWRNGLEEAMRRGGTSLSATMHVLSQTDPSFKHALDKVKKEQKDEEEEIY